MLNLHFPIPYNYEDTDPNQVGEIYNSCIHVSFPLDLDKWHKEWESANSTLHNYITEPSKMPAGYSVTREQGGGKYKLSCKSLVKQILGNLPL